MFKRNIGVAICSHERRFCNLCYVPRRSRQPPEIWEGGLANNEKIMVDFPTEAFGRQREANSASGGLVIDHNGTVHCSRLYVHMADVARVANNRNAFAEEGSRRRYISSSMPPLISSASAEAAKKSSPLHLRRRGGTTRPKRRITNKSFFSAWCCSRCRNEIIVSRAGRGRRVSRRPGGRNTSSSEAEKKFSAMDYACVALQLRQGRKPCSIHKMEVPTPLFADGRKEDEINIAAVCSSTPLCLMKGNAKSRSGEPKSHLPFLPRCTYCIPRTCLSLLPSPSQGHTAGNYMLRKDTMGNKRGKVESNKIYLFILQFPSLLFYVRD